MRYPQSVGVESIGEFSERIDVRSPGEFTEDHLPGACNHPVLDDQQRAIVGTLDAQQSPFAARRVGAAMTAHNIASMIEREFHDRPANWRPLVYCWRGGQRSRSLALVLHEVGWRPALLEGGYKAYRRAVRNQLEHLPSQFEWIVICGPTGSGKTRLLGALGKAGGQVLDLEAIACHRGSVLGDIIARPQPTQRHFETDLWQALSRFDPQRPIYVEAESRKIGMLQIPPALVAAMRGAQCVRIEAPLSARVQHLLIEYQHFVSDPQALAERLDRLRELHSRERVERWKAQAAGGDSGGFVAEVLAQHYDPAYQRSLERTFPQAGVARALHLDRLEEVEFAQAAGRLLARSPATSAA